MTHLTLEKIQFVKKTFCIDEEHKIENMNLEDAVIWATLEQAEKIALGECAIIEKEMAKSVLPMAVYMTVFGKLPQPPRED